VIAEAACIGGEPDLNAAVMRVARAPGEDQNADARQQNAANHTSRNAFTVKRKKPHAGA
jgi:hypothetical protein